MFARHVPGLAVTATLVATLVVPLAQSTPASAAACTSLHSGSRGACVTTLQKRLVALRYDLSAPDGSFGPQTYHAVMAFQKVNGLSRTGAVNATTST
jgi:peptidoglycan hydrolase-like protein with peptidoglycan-binding domain